MRQGNILNVKCLHFTDVCQRYDWRTWCVWENCPPLSNVRKSKQLVFVNSAAEPDKCLTFSVTGRANSHKLQMDYEIQLPRSRSESAATCISTFHQTHLKVFIVTVTRHVWSRVGVLVCCTCSDCSRWPFTRKDIDFTL